jgi:hypothetical protein
MIDPIDPLPTRERQNIKPVGSCDAAFRPHPVIDDQAVHAYFMRDMIDTA